MELVIKNSFRSLAPPERNSKWTQCVTPYIKMNQLLTRLAKIEEENHRLRSENDRFKNTLEDTNVTLKDEFCRFEKEIKGLKQTIIRQNDQIISLAARVGAQEANRVSFVVGLP